MKRYILMLCFAILNISQAEEIQTVDLKLKATCFAKGNFFDIRKYYSLEAIIKNANGLDDAHSYNLANEKKSNYNIDRVYFNPDKTEFKINVGSYQGINNNDFIDFIKGKNHKLVVSKKYVVKEKRLKKNLYPKPSIINGNIIWEKPKEEYEFIEVEKYKDLFYNINFDLKDIIKTTELCKEQIQNDTTKLYFKYVIFIGILFAFLFYIYLQIKEIILAIKNKSKKIITEFKKEKETKRIKDIAEKETKRIKDIAEEESIRASIQKSIKESDEDDLKELQDLINKSIQKGDSETAQALLKILKKKKNKKE